jgi:hypothetical protein
MAATMEDLEAILREHNVEFISISTPRFNGNTYQANVRNGPGWSVGDFKETMLESVIDALQKKAGWESPTVTIGESADDLEDLLG